MRHPLERLFHLIVGDAVFPGDVLGVGGGVRRAALDLKGVDVVPDLHDQAHDRARAFPFVHDVGAAGELVDVC